MSVLGFLAAATQTRVELRIASEAIPDARNAPDRDFMVPIPLCIEPGRPFGHGYCRARAMGLQESVVVVPTGAELVVV